MRSITYDESIISACCAADDCRQCANLAGYGSLPKGFICAFVGGWLFTTPSFLSTFYACAIALNTQLVFVHKCIPNNNKQKLYLVIPPILAVLICKSVISLSETTQDIRTDLVIQRLLL